MTLPQSALEMADLIGLPATLALVKSFGGLTIDVPSERAVSSKTRDNLVAVIGQEATSDLIRNYGGERVCIPRCAGSLRAARDGEIIAAFDAGQSVRVLARAYSMTERNLRNILKRTPQPPDEPAAPRKPSSTKGNHDVRK